jgi:hypothetical protein
MKLGTLTCCSVRVSSVHLRRPGIPARFCASS